MNFRYPNTLPPGTSETRLAVHQTPGEQTPLAQMCAFLKLPRVNIFEKKTNWDVMKRLKKIITNEDKQKTFFFP